MESYRILSLGLRLGIGLGIGIGKGIGAEWLGCAIGSMRWSLANLEMSQSAKVQSTSLFKSFPLRPGRRRAWALRDGGGLYPSQNKKINKIKIKNKNKNKNKKIKINKNKNKK